MSSIAKLADLGSEPLGGPLAPDDLAAIPQIRGSGLDALLLEKNGFYAFEGALLVRPLSSGAEIGLVAWNDTDLWRGGYRGLADGCFCFAESIFGDQFCLSNGAVMMFYPETGEKETVAPSVEEWASQILGEYKLLTGHRFAREWQVLHGALPAGQRLMPKVPFVLGGEFAMDNLFALDAVQGMRTRASLAVQLRDLPDGSTIKFKVVL